MVYQDQEPLPYGWKFFARKFGAFKAEDNEMLSYCREMFFFFVLNSKRKPTAAAQHI